MSRLEEIKQYAGYGEFKTENGKMFPQSVNLSTEHYEWLINRVEELESNLLKLKQWKFETEPYVKSLERQNKRYKRALEEISNAECNSEGLDAERELDKVTDVAFKALEESE